jgi:hypothetical protein
VNARTRGLAWPALYLALAIVHTWPLAGDPAHLSRHDNADAQLNEWIVAWVAHQLPRNPTALFDANIFHPEPRTLAFSESLVVPALMVAPLQWVGVSTLASYNLLVILGLALTGWLTHRLVARWTGDEWAGVAAGCLAAFNAHTLTRLPHVQAAHAEFLPMTLLALDQLFVRARVRDALRLAGWFTLQALSSTYLMVFTAIGCVVAAAARPGEWFGPRAHVVLPRIGLAAAVSGLALAGFLYPYYRASVDQGLSRSLADVAMYSASPADYLSTAGRLHFAAWSHRFYEPGASSLFPGLTALLLAGVAALGGHLWHDRRARMVAAIGVVGAVLSFGPVLPIYRWLYAVFPLLHGIRNASRFGFLALFAIAVLAGFGLARVRQWAAGRWSPFTVLLITIGLLVAINLEAIRAPLPYTRAAPLSPVYDRLAEIPGAVVVELPFPSPERIDANAPYVLASTRHWKPLVNGFSGFVPDSYLRHAATLGAFPSPESMTMVRRLGVTHLVAHGTPLREAIEASAVGRSLTHVAGDDEVRLYRVGPPATD